MFIGIVCWLAAVLVGITGSFALYKWTALGGYADRVMAAVVRPVPPSFDRLRFIHLDDGASPEELAALAGVSGVSNDDPYSLRRVHAKLAERLAPARPGCAVWDIFFTSETEHDGPLRDGLASLTDAGVPVCLAVRAYPLDTGVPALSPTLLRTPRLRWGCASAGEGPAGLSPTMAARRGDGAVIPSLPLAAALAYAKPDARPVFAFDDGAAGIGVGLQILSAGGAFALPATQRVPVRSIQEQSFDDALTGLRRGDLVAITDAAVPADGELRRATVTYADALRMSDAQLADFVRDRIVVIGDARTTTARPDLRTLADGRTVCGAYIVGAAIAQASVGAAVRLPSPVESFLILAVAAAAGVLVGGLTARFWRRVAAASVLAALATSFCAWLYHMEVIYITPGAVAVAGLAGLVIAGAVRQESSTRTPARAVPDVAT